MRAPVLSWREFVSPWRLGPHDSERVMRAETLVDYFQPQLSVVSLLMEEMTKVIMPFDTDPLLWAAALNDKVVESVVASATDLNSRHVRPKR